MCSVAAERFELPPVFPPRSKRPLAMDYVSPIEAPECHVNGETDQSKQLALLGALAVWATRPWRLEALVASKRLALCATDVEARRSWERGLVCFYANEPRTLHLDSGSWQVLLQVDEICISDLPTLAGVISALAQRACQLHVMATALWIKEGAGFCWSNNMLVSWQLCSALSLLQRWSTFFESAWQAPCFTVDESWQTPTTLTWSTGPCAPRPADATFDKLASTAFVDLEGDQRAGWWDAVPKGEKSGVLCVASI